MTGRAEEGGGGRGPGLVSSFSNWNLAKRLPRADDQEDTENKLTWERV